MRTTAATLVTIGLGAIALLAGMAIVGTWLFRDTLGARERATQLAALSPGDTLPTVLTIMGPPDERCEGVTEIIWPLAGRPRDTEADRAMLEAGTAIIFIYRFSDRELLRTSSCTPLYNDAILGFTEGGKLLWIVPFAGQSAVLYES